MTYATTITPSAEREMRSLTAEMLRRAHQRIQRLAESPYAPGTVKLTVVQGYRVRVGDYRIIFSVDDTANTVEILAVRHRKEAYR